MLVVTTKEQKKLYQGNEKIKEIYTHAEISNFTEVNSLQFDVVEKMKNVQLKVESCLDRFLLDYQEKKKIYYTALNFWVSFFDSHEINAVIISGVNHGMPYDGIPYGIAQIRKDVYLYTIDVIVYSKRAICNHTRNQFIKIMKGDDNNERKIDVAYSMAYHEITSKIWNKSNAITRLLCKALYKIGGFLALEFIYDVYKGNFNLRDEGGNGIYYNYFDKLKSYRNMKRIRKALKKMEQPYSFHGEKFVFYAMHFEPEGGILARTSMESQWVLIKMIQASLPEGWVLYVKEHPHQFILNNWKMEYYINNIDYFKSKRFYDEINKLDKVFLINSAVSSQILLKDAVAIATMNGTIMLEAVEYNKPVLLLASNTVPLQMCDDYFKIKSQSDCKEALMMIQQGFRPKYEDVSDKMYDYLETDDKKGFANMVKSIVEDMKTV